MAEAENHKEIEPETTANGQQAQPQSRSIGQRLRSLLRRRERGQQQKERRPDDAVKLGCGGLFRRKKRADDGEDAQKPTEKPKKSKDIKGGTVKIEQGPHTEMWSSIVNKSFIGTGAFHRAAVCSLESGAVLACNPADFTPTVEQVAALRDNFDCRSVFSAAGFGLADTVYSLLEEVGGKDMLCGQDEARGQTLLVCKTKTALLAAACQGAPDRGAGMLGDMRQHFISQEM